MPNNRQWGVVSLVLVLSFVGINVSLRAKLTDEPQKDDEGFVSLFNGKDFSGDVRRGATNDEEVAIASDSPALRIDSLFQTATTVVRNSEKGFSLGN